MTLLSGESFSTDMNGGGDRRRKKSRTKISKKFFSITRTLSSSSKNGFTTSRSVDEEMTSSGNHTCIASHLSLIDIPNSIHNLHNYSQPDLIAINNLPLIKPNERKPGLAGLKGESIEVFEGTKELKDVGNKTVIVTNTPATPDRSAQSYDAAITRSESTGKESLQTSSADTSRRCSLCSKDLSKSVTASCQGSVSEKGLLSLERSDNYNDTQDNLSRSSDSARSVDLVVLRSSPGDQFGGKDKKEKSSGSSDKEKRKRSTLSNVFNPTYKSRSEEFKRIFGKDLPLEERLLVDYSCALQRDILVHGRLYISPNYLCFHAKIFGWETSVTLRLSEVTAVTKEKTALVIPNAIQVVTDSDRFFFASFASRDKTFVTIFKIWQMSLLDEPLSSVSWTAFIRSMYGDELGLNSEEESELMLPPSVNDISSILECDSLSIQVEQAEDASSYCSKTDPVATPSGDLTDNGHTSSMSPDENFRMSLPPKESCLSSTATLQVNKESTSSPTSRLSLGLKESLDSDESELGDSSDNELRLHAIPLESKINVPEIEPPPCPVSHTGRMMIEITLPFNVDELFNMMFTASNFYLSFQAERKTTDLQAGSWVPQENTTKVRKISYTIQLASFGIKSCRTSESQVLLCHTQPGLMYSIDCEIQNSGIPYSDTFYVLSHFCLTRVSLYETKLSVTSSITYNKSVWGVIKNFIEKNTWAGMEEYYNHLERYLRALPPPEHPIQEHRNSKKEGKARRNAVQRQRRVRTHSRGDMESFTAPPPSIILAGGNPTSSNDGDSNKPTPAHKRKVTADGPITTCLENVKSPKSKSSWEEVAYKILAVVLIILVLMNVLLFRRIGNLEVTVSKIAEQQEKVSFSSSSDELPASYEGWVSLLRQQEENHRKEVDRWKLVIESSVNTLKQTQSSLSAVLKSMSEDKFTGYLHKECGESQDCDL
ncbi:protein Aster-B-like isoform X2 [Artemia franciscana]|uniref:protein Aster-B-like isoform X2 n=1 Tax=Artemia franciscana TaxID=6661 RepID=UPI0032DA1834